MPISDASIKFSMIYRNPLNHPTVLFRRSSILSIGSYENIPCFEDFFLWLKARKSGLVFANIPEPLVSMSRSNVLERRQGLQYFKFETSFVFLAFRRSLLSPLEFFVLLSRAIFRLLPLPSWMLKLLMFWRSRAPDL